MKTLVYNDCLIGFGGIENYYKCAKCGKYRLRENCKEHNGIYICNACIKKQNNNEQIARH